MSRHPSTSHPWRCLVTIGTLCTAALYARPEDPPSLPPAAAHRVDFVKEVQPIFAASCYPSHGPHKQRANLRLDRKRSALDAEVLLPGKSASSSLIRYVAGLVPDKKMPPKGPPLTARQVGILRAWIDQGAPWPDAADAGSDGTGGHWSLRPLTLPRVPAVKNQDWVRTPIDAFILARLEEQGMTPSPAADRRTLIRRVTFDLTGLPPTPEEVEAFLADPAPDAYDRLVDRLLASPHYGERWARHWMDVIHFAETHGHDQDAPRENAWPYRDYLIRSLNEDKPYPRFVEEQLAGDVLYPDDPRGVVATGFIAAGPWDESSQKDIRDDTLDKKAAQNLDRDDMVTTAFSTFLSTSVHCARCHDHKFDPIRQEEYYGLQAVFAGVDRANRPYDPDPAVAHSRRELTRRREEILSGRTSPPSLLLDPAARADVAAWEQARPGSQQSWVALEPSGIASSAGSTPVKLPDLSVRFAGPRPEKDTYTVEALTDLKGLTGVRLELLTDDEFPHKGPGRQDNGNLHLSEFRVRVGPRAAPDQRKPVVLQNPTADFNQAGWEIAKAIDGRPETAWGIFPEVGRPHTAVFEFKEPVGFDGGTALTFVLEQLHGGGHLIGRLRLSVTTLPHPAQARLLPGNVREALAVPPDRRSDAQRAELARHVLLARVEAQLGALPAPKMVYAAASDFQPLGSFKPARGCRPVFLLRRGDIKNPGAAATPGALACVPGLVARFQLPHPDDEGSRRVALAHWITDPRNVLTWRSIVNRVWHYHFGRGIAASPNDLGRMGARPTHPELLDWLAVTFRDGGASLKRLHRLIVTSAVYTQSSAHQPDYARRDADNLVLWRMNRGRLDAESVRDAVLAITGRLDRAMGGPSVKQFLQSPGIHVTPLVDYLRFDVDSPAGRRRSVYRFLFRTLPDPFMDALDCPDASQFTPARSTSVTALQALALLNDRFMVRQCEHFAERVRAAGTTPDAQVEAAYRLALGRPPSATETARLAAYAARHGLANACRLILNSNEFMFVP